MDFVVKKSAVYLELEWLVKAKLPDSRKERFALNMISVKDGTFYACDGHRMHCLKVEHFTDNYQDGLYNLYKTKEGFMLEKDGIGKTYPDVEKVIPKVFFEWGEIVLSKDNDRNAAMLLKALPPDTGIMLKYLEDAGCGICHFKDKNNPILIDGGKRKSVIMPFEI